MSSEPKNMYVGNIKIKSDTIGAKTTVSIGGVIIPVQALTIDLRPSEFNKVTMQVLADEIDIEALQNHTNVVIIGGENEQEN